MSVLRDIMYLEHILDGIEKIHEYTNGLSKAGFDENSLVQDGVIRQLEIIGEATKRISDALRKQYPELPWKDMAGMRDVLIHNYIHVEIDTVWKTVKDSLPKLKIQLSSILEKLTEN